MLIRIRSTGAVMYESEFRANNPNTSFPQQITVEVLNEFGADPVLNGAQPTPTFYQVVAQDGVEEVNGQWFTKFICVDMDQEAKDAKDAQCKAANKATAESKLAATDWTQVADVPLLNKQEFTDYRAAVRAIALNPPVQATFPDLPVEQWELEMLDQLERIAIIETKVETLEANHKEMLRLMHEIKDEMTRYKGFLGGIAFLASGVVIFITLAKEWIIKHL